MTHLLVILDTIRTFQKGTDTNIRNVVEKERYEVAFRIQSNICNGAFFRKLLTAKSFNLDIRPGSKYPSDEQKKLFSF